MSNEVINISQLFNASGLITRQAARDLFDILSKSTENNINLDFSEISYATRSFFDELHSHRTKLNLLGKKVRFIKLNENLRSLLDLVEKKSRYKNSITYTSVANVKTINM
ncbi:MAG: hypothetical protein FVQ77_04355 [Cytophagales bacterium]|nr:hypothetical protein [Cytophagales bacterium]